MNELEEARERRLKAYIDMLKEAYEVDDYGLADMLGINRAQWTRNNNLPWKEKRWSFFTKLAAVTGTSIKWFVIE